MRTCGPAASGTRERLQVTQLPSYSPDYNPIEGIWNLLKWVEPRNVRSQDLAHLDDELRRAVTRLRHRRLVLHGCVRQVG